MLPKIVNGQHDVRSLRPYPNGPPTDLPQIISITIFTFCKQQPPQAMDKHAQTRHQCLDTFCETTKPWNTRKATDRDTTLGRGTQVRVGT